MLFRQNRSGREVAGLATSTCVWSCVWPGVARYFLVMFSLFSRYFVCALVIFSLFARYFLVIFTACSLFIRYFACVLVIYFISSLFVRYVVWPRYVFVMSFECVLVICSSFSFVLDTEKPTQQLHYCVASLWSLIRSGLERAQQNLELPQHTAFD